MVFYTYIRHNVNSWKEKQDKYTFRKKKRLWLISNILCNVRLYIIIHGATKLFFLYRKRNIIFHIKMICMQDFVKDPMQLIPVGLMRIDILWIIPQM